MYEELLKMLEEHGEFVGGEPRYLAMGELFDRWEPKVKLYKYSPENDIVIRLGAPDMKPDGYLVTERGGVYQPRNDHISEVKPAEIRKLYDYITATYEDEFGGESEW